MEAGGKRGGEMVPSGAAGKNWWLFLGASFPRVLQLAPTCVSREPSLIGAVSVAAGQSGAVAVLQRRGLVRSHRATAILGTSLPRCQSLRRGERRWRRSRCAVQPRNADGSTHDGADNSN